MQDGDSVPQAQEAGGESEGGNWVAVGLIGHDGAFCFPRMVPPSSGPFTCSLCLGVSLREIVPPWSYFRLFQTCPIPACTQHVHTNVPLVCAYLPEASERSP